MAKTQNTVYEIVSDMSSRYDSLEERIIGLEDKLVNIQEQVELLPDLINRVLTQHQQAQAASNKDNATNSNNNSNSTDRSNERRNFLHPESAALPNANPALLSHSRSVPTTSAPYHWPASPILPPISSRTPHLVPEPLHPNS
ncbi:Small conductance calcium-activated potassium channel protein 2 [Homalodisca vitripennis]|nr:Small conductance calcium-activated potassium channel protein 2 [Homalodisca vitripennis]